MKQFVLLLYIFTAMMLAILSESPIASPATDAFERKDYSSAKALFAAKPESSEAIYYLGRIAFNEGDFDAAEELLLKIVTKHPTNADYHYWFARTLSNQAANASIFSAPGYASDALKHYKKVLGLDPKHIPAMRGLIGFYREAPAIAGGSIKKALALAGKLETVDAEEGLIAKLDIYGSENDDQAQLATASELAESFQNSSRALSKAGFIFQGKQRYKKAFDLFKRASQTKDKEHDEDNSRLSAQYQVGRTAVMSGEFTNGGITALENYLTQDIPHSLPSKQWARLRLASLYQRQGKVAEARELTTELSKNAEDKSLQRRAEMLLEELGE